VDQVKVYDAVPSFINALNSSPLWSVIRLYTGSDGQSVGGIEAGTTFKVTSWTSPVNWNSASVAQGLSWTGNDGKKRARFTLELWKKVLQKLIIDKSVPNQPNDSIYILYLDSQAFFDPWITAAQSSGSCAFHGYVNGLSGTGIASTDTYFFGVLAYIDSDSVCYKIADEAMRFKSQNGRSNSLYVKSNNYFNTLARKLIFAV
jgi:hypothetical protein